MRPATPWVIRTRGSVMESVRFKNKTWDVAADLRVPKDFDPAKKYPAIICAPRSAAARSRRPTVSTPNGSPSSGT